MKITFFGCLMGIGFTATAQTGNVGIGTTTPIKLLHILKGAGSGAVSTPATSVLVDADTTHYLSMLTPLGRETGILHGRPGGSIRSGLIFNNNSGIRFSAGGNNTRMLLDSVGRLGIGTAPVQKLDINGKIKVGDDAEAPAEGTIRWNNIKKDFEGYTGTAWVSLTKAGVPQLGEGSAGPVSDYKSVFPADINEIKEFGYSVDIDSNYAIIGAVKSNFIPPVRNGAVYIFIKQPGGIWLQQSKLLPDATDLVGIFGYRVAIYGEYAAITDFYDDSSGVSNTSQVYIFKRTGTTWAKQAIINEVASTVFNPQFNNFGYAIDLDSVHLVVGAPLHNSHLGAAFVYQRTGTTWSAPVSLTHQTTNIEVSPHFGTSVSIYNAEIIVGSPDEVDVIGPQGQQVPTTPYGRVYLYSKQTGVWNNLFDIMPGSYGNDPDNPMSIVTKFGQHIALYDRYMVVAAPWDNSVFFYANDGSGEIRFGYSDIKAVNMYKDKAAILSGSKIYIHKRMGSTWNLYAFYKDPDNGVPVSCAIWKNEIIMGIPFFHKCAGANCFNTGKATIATVE